MSEYLDISLPITPDLPVWPESLSIKFDRINDMHTGDPHTDTDLHFSAHTGTHIDAPSHFIKDGKSLSDIPLSTLIGPAIVVEIPNVDIIAAADLEGLDLPRGTSRLLLKTKNSDLWAKGVDKFQKDFVALHEDAAQWVVDHRIQLIAIDYLSIQPFNSGPETHQILLEHEIIVLEGVNLAGVLPGSYELLCLPLRLVGIEAAPVRALLRKIDL